MVIFFSLPPSTSLMEIFDEGNQHFSSSGIDRFCCKIGSNTKQIAFSVFNLIASFGTVNQTFILLSITFGIL